MALSLLGGGVAFGVARADGEPRVRATAATPGTTTPDPSTSASTTTTTPPAREATIAFAGDVLIHSGVWEAADTGNGYDFSPMLAPIAPQLSAADLAICHLEVTLGRPEDPLSSYPRFRAPPALATDLAEAGFDGCSVASNHALDFGEQGVAATLDAFDQVGIDHAGTARSPEESAQPARYEADGIRVAQLSYAYGFNGFIRPTGKEWLVDQIDPALILADAQAARAAGAELVIVSLHWGNEYTHDVVAAQQVVADAIAAVPGAVDLIVGHHAHVVQPISKVGDLWVVWGMGNMLSNNTPRCCRDEATDGVVVTVTVGDVAGSGSVGVKGIAFTPTWNERTTFRVLPAADALASLVDPALAADLRASFARTAESVLMLGARDLGVAPDRPLPP
jgi:poly-gamma-glutamate synthesis protein (capsule biosynthesis protein)